MARIRTAVACVAAGLLGTGIVAAVMAAPAPAQPPKAKVKWEYKALSQSQLNEMAPKGSKDKLTDTLNQLGDEGWELVTVTASPVSVSGVNKGTATSISMSSYRFFFKRQR